MLKTDDVNSELMTFLNRQTLNRNKCVFFVILHSDVDFKHMSAINFWTDEDTVKVA